MNPTKISSKIFLTTSIAGIMALSSATTFAEVEDNTKLKTYTDPTTGELKVAPRLLSEMNEAEKSMLSKQEKQFLEDIEAQINKEKLEVKE
jgi:hypothetical protein